MSTPVTLIPGDGIGPGITEATVRLLAAAGAQIAWDPQLAGMAAVEAVNDPIPEATLDSIRRTKVALKGPLETPVGKGFRSINVALRKTFDLYANVRPAVSVLPGLRYDGVDIVLWYARTPRDCTSASRTTSRLRAIRTRPRSPSPW